jgi:hypothetical protein
MEALISVIVPIGEIRLNSRGLGSGVAAATLPASETKRAMSLAGPKI